MKKKTGRPKKYNTSNEMQVKIDNYFQQCDEKEVPYTIEGLCVALDMDRVSVLNYAKDEEFFSTIKKAKQKISDNLIQQALTNKVNPTVAIFLMKCNLKYREHEEAQADNGQTTIIKIVRDENN